MTVRPLRVCVFGDSFVAGVGDPAHRGWVGRVAERALAELPVDLTVYNLGIRRDTSSDVRARWPSEALARFSREYDNRMIVSFGVNDTTLQNGTLRVEPAESESNLGATSWMREADRGDGAHPGAQGYTDLADLVCADITAWLGTSADSVGGRV
ncbi:GDSL-type esterase/lipase family protein [Rhodococcus sp. SJ-2]